MLDAEDGFNTLISLDAHITGYTSCTIDWSEFTLNCEKEDLLENNPEIEANQFRNPRGFIDQILFPCEFTSGFTG
jgi:hypothetical protein